jgi:hypothetical protein
MRNTLRALAVFLALQPVLAVAQSQVPLGYHTVWGRIGAQPGDTGPGQQIPFATLGVLLLGGPQSPNLIYAGPASGPSANPGFRLQVGADLPNPGASSKGGIQSLAAVSHFFMTGISTLGIPSTGRPACADLSDSTPSCSTDATNATNIGSGTLNTVRLPSPFTSGTASGNTSKFGTTSGTLTNGHCASYDASGNLIDSGAICGSAALTLLNTLTASASATVSDTTSFTGTYSVYEIVFENIIPATASTTCQIQIHSGGAFQTSSYVSSQLNANGTGTGLAVVTGSIPCNVGTSISTAGPGISGSIRVTVPSGTTAPKLWQGMFAHQGSTAILWTVQAGGYWASNAAVDGFQVCFSSSVPTCNVNITSGVIKIYGIQ